MSFFKELRRRNVFRVGFAYMIVAWLLLQVADTLGPALRLPEWFQSGVVFVLILGFPLALIFAWAFEMTPEGIKREREVDRSQSITPQTGKKLNAAIIGLLVLAVVYLGLDKFVFEHGHDAETVAGEPSIAVLPFANMSDDAGNEFFADGITEELLNLLAKIPELQVTSRTSAFQFKGKDIDIPTVAKQLNVEHVLEGSVRKAGTKVRITAQLIDAGTDKHIWSETYDRELDDIFTIQDEIAREVVDQLHVTLLGSAPKTRETDTRAYTLYLEGRHFLERDQPETFPQALALFEQATQIDPNYAPAWYGRARSIREMANRGDFDLHEGTEQARQWTRRALELDPALAEAWAWMSHLSIGYDFNWDEARTFIARALDAGPSHPDVLAEAHWFHLALGELQIAREFAEKALAQDPLSKIRLEQAGRVYFFLGDWDRALEFLRKNVAVNGRDAWPGDTASATMMRGDYAEAARLTDELKSWDNEVYFNFVGAQTLYAAGRHEEAAACLNWVTDNLGIPFGYQIAQQHTLQKNPDKAFEWLEISYKNRDGGLTYLLVDPFMQPLHDDPRWRPFLEKMNLLEYWDVMRNRDKTESERSAAPT